MIIKTEKEHKEPLLSIIEKSGQFDSDGLAHVASRLDEHFSNLEDAIWLTAMDSDPIGVAYCAPEPVTSGTWNLLMLWLKEGFEGKGIGSQLVSEVEKCLQLRQARLLIVETSQLPEFDKARTLYEKSGFRLEAEVKDFFDAGDNKLIYTKPVVPS